MLDAFRGVKVVAVVRNNLFELYLVLNVVVHFLLVWEKAPTAVFVFVDCYVEVI